MTWYVVARMDNNYPLLIYPDKARAEIVAKPNGCKVVSVMVINKHQNKLKKERLQP